MSLHSGILMVRADVVGEIGDVLASFDCDVVEVRRVGSWERAIEEVQYPRADKPRHVVHKAATCLAGWTVILDPEMLLFMNEEACRNLAARTKAPVFGMLCEGTSGSYAFGYFDPELKRFVSTVDGVVERNEGDPLPFEGGINAEDLFEDDVLEMMTRLGVDYFDLEKGDWSVIEIDESRLLPPELQNVPIPPLPKRKKSWWQFWR